VVETSADEGCMRDGERAGNLPDRHDVCFCLVVWVVCIEIFQEAPRSFTV
jgi:hypothetical protein